MKIREKYINRCLQLAKKGLGFTRPNPMVGCVIVHDGLIIGEGFTSPYGGPHAEVNAITSVVNKALLNEATLYVSLEPCNHSGKTPPCVDLIIKHKFKKVVIGCVDPFKAVAGKGIENLKSAGIIVEVGVLEEECKTVNRRFFTVHLKKRPYIILKWAETADGYFDKDRTQPHTGPNWISNAYTQQMVHQLRAQEHAILVGTKTVQNDNPGLTVRSWSGDNPIKVILDRAIKISNEAAVFQGDGKVLVFTEKKRKNTAKKQYIRIDFSRSLAEQICVQLYELGIQSVLIEGGAQTLQTFINANLWDEAVVFKGETKFESGLLAPTITGILAYKSKIADTELEWLTRAI